MAASLCRSRPRGERRPIERSVRFVIGDQFGDVGVERGPVSLAGKGLHELAFGIDQRQRGPGVDAGSLPDRQIRIVENRMFDLVANDGSANVFRILFVRELRRMHADDDDVARVFVLEELQIGQDVHAVDAAIRPEIEEHDLAAEILQLDRSGNIEPAVAAVKQVSRHVDPLGERIGNAVMLGSRPSLGLIELGQRDRQGRTRQAKRTATRQKRTARRSQVVHRVEAL